MSNDIYIDSVTGDAGGDGSARSPYQAYSTALAAGISSGDTVWVRGSLAEQISLLGGVTYRKWGSARFVVTGGGARTYCMHAEDGSSGWTVIGAELTAATSHGFALVGSGSGRFFGCYSHANPAGNGFGSVASTADGEVHFYGCITDNNLDGFSAVNTAKFVCYDCAATTETNGFEALDDANLKAFRCVATTCAIAFNLRHNSGRAILAGCQAYLCQDSFLHIPSSTSLTTAMAQPSTLAYACAGGLGIAPSAEAAGFVVSEGAHMDVLSCSVYNAGDTVASNLLISFDCRDAANAGGMVTTIRVLGCATHTLVDVQAYHGRAFTPANVLDWDYNAYTSVSGDRFLIGAVAKTFAEWQDEANLDSGSFQFTAVMVGPPVSEATLLNARLTPTTGPDTPFVPNLQTLLESKGLSSIWTELAWATPAIVARDRDLANANRRVFAFSASMAFSAVAGGVFDVTEELWFPGAFQEGILAGTDTEVHVNASANGGTLLLVDRDFNTALLDLRINRESVAGDRSRRVVIIGGFVTQNAITVPTKVVIWAGKKAAGLPVAVAMLTYAQQIPERALPPGMDAYLEVGDPGVAVQGVGEINYRIETVDDVDGLAGPKPVGVGLTAARLS